MKLSCQKQCLGFTSKGARKTHLGELREGQSIAVLRTERFPTLQNIGPNTADAKMGPQELVVLTRIPQIDARVVSMLSINNCFVINTVELTAAARAIA